MENESPTKTLQKLRAKNTSSLIRGHVNIDSLRNKFEMLKDWIKDNVDILLISETKLDEFFPICQFQIDGFSTPYRRDKDKNAGGVQNMPPKLVSFKNDNTIEQIFIESNLRRQIALS